MDILVKNQPYYMYPFIHLLNNGNLFVFVSKMSQIFNVATLPELATVERQQLRSRYHHLRWWPVPRHHRAGLLHAVRDFERGAIGRADDHVELIVGDVGDVGDGLLAWQRGHIAWGLMIDINRISMDSDQFIVFDVANSNVMASCR